MSDVHRWLSYDELAEARGISRLSAERLVRRRKWQRRPGNDGTVRVLIPPGEDSRPDSRPDDRPDSRPDNRPDSRPDNRPDSRPDDRADIFRISSAFEAAIAALAERAQTAEQRADAERQRADRAEERAQTAEVALAVERACARSWLLGRLWRR